MSDFRRDPIAGHWVMMAPGRAHRPQDFELRPQTQLQTAAHCPFCQGHECETPNPIRVFPADASLGTGATGKWAVRVVPNKFPAVSRHGLAAIPENAAEPSLFQTEPAYGHHEVIIESPRHLDRWSDLTVGELTTVLSAYQDCLIRASQDPKLVFGLVFKNQGPMAGASLTHLHSQFLASARLPAVLAAELRSSQEFYLRHQACLFCRLLEAETRGHERMVARSARFTCLTPFASRSAFELCVLPNRHAHRFEAASFEEIGELAVFLQEILIRLARATRFADFNLWLHTAPFDFDPQDHYHWHFEIVPRMANLAGFEWGTGCYINPIPPEQAAAALRSCFDEDPTEITKLRPLR